jgi:hypothetical protein
MTAVTAIGGCDVGDGHALQDPVQFFRRSGDIDWFGRCSCGMVSYDFEHKAGAKAWRCPLAELDEEIQEERRKNERRNRAFIDAMAEHHARLRGEA